jgi:hypothetical protein
VLGVAQSHHRAQLGPSRYFQFRFRREHRGPGLVAGTGRREDCRDPRPPTEAGLSPVRRCGRRIAITVNTSAASGSSPALAQKGANRSAPAETLGMRLRPSVNA